MNYSGINAKIKGMKGNLLEYEDYETLSEMKSVGEVFFSLKEKPGYSKLLNELEGVEIHRHLVEQKIFMSINNDYGRVYNYISDYRMRKFISAYFLDFEIYIIKLLLGMLFDERDINYSYEDMKLLFNRNTNIDVRKLASSKNVPDFIENLVGSEYYHVLSHGFNEHVSLFKLEMQLDLYYYINLWKKIRLYLDKKNRKVMEHIVGTEIDLRNIIWVYRLKTFFGLGGASIYACIIPISYRLNSEFVSRFVEAKSAAELRDEFQRSPYGNLFAGLEDVDAEKRHLEYSPFRAIETVFYDQMKLTYARAAAFQVNSIATTVAYFYEKELEILNLSSLVEGVRYGLDSKKIMKYLYLYRSDGGRLNGRNDEIYKYNGTN